MQVCEDNYKMHIKVWDKDERHKACETDNY